MADVVGTSGGVIGSRSFGADAEAVAAQVAAVRPRAAGGRRRRDAQALPGARRHVGRLAHRAAGARADPRSASTRSTCARSQAGIDAGAWLVMSGHLDVRAVEPGVPATFSHKVLTGVLRGELGFQGVVVSDAMNMAPAMRWPAGEAAVRALEAGNDLLLMPPNLGDAYDGVLAALRSGDLPRERLVDAATRVLTLRFRLAGTPLPAFTGLNSAAHRRAADGLAASAVTQLRGRCAAAVRGPVTVTASGGRETSRALLERTLKRPGRAHPGQRRHGRAPRRVRRRRGRSARRRRGHRRHGHPVPARPLALRHPPGDVLVLARLAHRPRPRPRRQGAPQRPVTRPGARFAPYACADAHRPSTRTADTVR